MIERQKQQFIRSSGQDLLCSGSSPGFQDGLLRGAHWIRVCTDLIIIGVNESCGSTLLSVSPRGLRHSCVVACASILGISTH